MNSIQQFYSENPFPGPYTIDNLKSYETTTTNRYISAIDRYLSDSIRVLDIGSGTGLLTNLFARKYRSEFVGIDFSDAIDYAASFASKHNITNVEYVKQDFFNYDTNCNNKFDVILAQSFVTHVPNFNEAFAKIKNHLAPGGVLILGVYNNYGKILKKIFRLNYFHQRLHLDQEHNPFEVSFAHKQICNEFNEYRLLEIMPSFKNHLVQLNALLNSRNGGLTLYVFKNEYNN